MPGDPADVGCAPVDVFLPVIEYVTEGRRRVEEIPGRSMQNAFGFSSGTTVGKITFQRLL